MTKTLPYKWEKSLLTQIIGICCICYKLLIIYLSTSNTEVAIGRPVLWFPARSPTREPPATCHTRASHLPGGRWQVILDPSWIQMSCDVLCWHIHNPWKALKSQVLMSQNLCFIFLCIRTKSRNHEGMWVSPVWSGSISQKPSIPLSSSVQPSPLKEQTPGPAPWLLGWQWQSTTKFQQKMHNGCLSNSPTLAPMFKQ